MQGFVEIMASDSMYDAIKKGHDNAVKLFGEQQIEHQRKLKKGEKKMKRCSDCIYMKKGIQGIRSDAGECHLDPPTVVPQGAAGAAAFWPVVDDDNFCGSFEPTMESALKRNGVPGAGASESIRGGRITRPVDPIQQPTDAANTVVNELDIEDSVPLHPDLRDKA